jgi:hypothetical protein
MIRIEPTAPDWLRDASLGRSMSAIHCAPHSGGTVKTVRAEAPASAGWSSSAIWPCAGSAQVIVHIGVVLAAERAVRVASA